jgi:predicted nucleic acid-binding protein
MAVLTVYLDNSILGGYYDSEFKEPTRRLWQMAEDGECRFVASVVTQEEASLAPSNVVRLFARTFANDTALLELTPRAEELAQAYLTVGVVSRKYVDDARHVAIATTHGIGVLVTWKFQHLANYRREAGFNRVNLENGYPAIRIISPLEIVYEGQDEDV